MAGRRKFFFERRILTDFGPVECEWQAAEKSLAKCELDDIAQPDHGYHRGRGRDNGGAGRQTRPATDANGSGRPSLEIKAYVLNSDIGFVKASEPAMIMVDTFPYSRYGTITGKVIKVGKDAIPGEAALLQQKNGSQPVSGGGLSQTAAAEPTSDLVFPVTVLPEKTNININGKSVSFSSGMSVVVEIEVRKQCAIDYFLFIFSRLFSGGCAVKRGKQQRFEDLLIKWANPWVDIEHFVRKLLLIGDTASVCLKKS